MSDEIVKSRKPRVKKTMAQRLAENAKRNENLAWDIARDALTEAGLQDVVESRANVMRYARECENLANPEYVAEQKAKLQARMDSLDARAAIATEYAPRAKSTLANVESLFVRIGKEISDAMTAGTTVDVVGIVNSILTPADRATLAETVDPFAAFRRKHSAEDNSEDMPDAGTDVIAGE